MNKQELKNYLRLTVELKRLEEKMETLRNKIEKPKSAVFTDTAKGGEKKDFTDMLDDLIELQEYYSERAKPIIAEQIRIENAIAQLADPIERAIMGYKYIDGFTWEEICVKIKYSWVQTHKYHGRALQNIKSE